MHGFFYILGLQTLVCVPVNLIFFSYSTISSYSTFFSLCSIPSQFSRLTGFLLSTCTKLTNTNKKAEYHQITRKLYYSYGRGILNAKEKFTLSLHMLAFVDHAYKILVQFDYNMGGKLFLHNVDLLLSLDSNVFWLAGRVSLGSNNSELPFWLCSSSIKRMRIVFKNYSCFRPHLA